MITLKILLLSLLCALIIAFYFHQFTYKIYALPIFTAGELNELSFVELVRACKRASI